MFISGDKQNNNNCNNFQNHILNHQNDPNLVIKADYSSNEPTQESASYEIVVKIEQERANNLKLYQKIKNKFSCFQYTLRPVNVTNDCDSMIREYGRLMTERQFLQKEATKLEYRFERQFKNTSEPYQFLIQLWRSEQQHHQDLNSQDTIDRINKALVRTKKGIDACLQNQENYNVGQLSPFELKSQAYQKLLGQLDSVNKRVAQLQILRLTKQTQYYEALKREREENANLRKNMQALSIKIGSFAEKEIELYRKISTLTASIMKKQEELDKLKAIEANTKRYLTENTNQGLCYEISISQLKFKGRGYVRIDKTFKQITAYLETAKGTALQILDLHSNSQIDSHSQTSIPDQLTKTDDPLESQSVKSTSYFSSARKPKRQREFHCFQTQQKSPLNAGSVTEMRFIRRS